MLRFRIATIGFVITGFLVMSSAASALTMGTTTPPTGATLPPCGTGILYFQTATDSSYVYTVPAGGGAISSWSTNTATGDTAGTSVSLVVLAPSGGGYTVAGVDTETLPTPLPTTGIASFTVAHPITAAAGDVLGLWSSGPYSCAFTGGTIPSAEVVSGATAASAPTAGTQYSTLVGSAPTSLMNLSVNLAQSQDIALAGAAAPASSVAGSGAAYVFNVANAGPGSGTITFTDSVPAALKVLGAGAGSGTCSTTGQTVTCTIDGLAAGATAPVIIAVSSATAGSFPDSATVTAALPDPAPANNTATATLTFTPAVVATVPSCKVVKLRGAPLAVAKVLLPALNCKLGKTTKKASKSVHKGDVISTSPGAGKTLTAGTKVNLVVSSGPPKKKKKKK
ncbi:MAG TPA: PASTA domain-containing protein [Solirubrobacteraceae bacterium]|nr:PASTA domain-containing protein [Solirubrobacteraceae bacterium]